MKYNNKKVAVGGETFDSQKEYKRWCELKLLERANLITNLQRQVTYVLIPPQKGERAVKYIADFLYSENGKTVVEDSKGIKTKDYIIKRKLMLYIHGIKILET